MGVVLTNELALEHGVQGRDDGTRAAAGTRIVATSNKIPLEDRLQPMMRGSSDQESGRVNATR
jgi:hypothetical protein